MPPFLIESSHYLPTKLSKRLARRPVDNLIKARLSEHRERIPSYSSTVP